MCIQWCCCHLESFNSICRFLVQSSKHSTLNNEPFVQERNRKISWISYSRTLQLQRCIFCYFFSYFHAHFLHSIFHGIAVIVSVSCLQNVNRFKCAVIVNSRCNCMERRKLIRNEHFEIFFGKTNADCGLWTAHGSVLMQRIVCKSLLCI